jgi:hypothetical protein
VLPLTPRPHERQVSSLFRGFPPGDPAPKPSVEPSPRFERGPSAIPRRRSDRWSYEGMCWPGWTRTSVANSASKADGPCPQSNRPPEPPPGPEPGTFRLQGGCAADCAKEASHRECSAVRTAWHLELPGPDPGRRATAGSSPSCARPDLNRDAPRGAPAPQAGESAVSPRAHRAATRGRTGPSAVRRRSRRPCAAAWLPSLDSNQEPSGSEPDAAAGLS